MNEYRLVCQYCDESWEINYFPHKEIYCSKCKDTNIKIVKLSTDKIDYYVGCPPFPEKPKKNEWPY